MTRRSRITLLVALALAGAHGGCALGAQESTSPVAVGARVRIYAPALRRDPYTGTIEVLRPDSVVLDTAHAQRRLGFEVNPVLVDQYRKVTIPLSTVEAMELSEGRTHRKTTIVGALLGGALGGALIGFSKAPEVNPSFKDIAKHVPEGALIGGVIGGTLGYLLGGERWSRVAVPKDR